MRLLSAPLQVIRDDLRAYLVMNAVVYGVLVLGLVIGILVPAIPAALVAQFTGSGANGLVQSVSSNVWAFALVIFLVNAIPTALLQITVPSLVVPFLGVAFFTLNVLRLGIQLAPTDSASAWTLLPHSVTMIVEFQAYVLLMFGGYLLGRSWIRPATIGADTRGQGYRRGLAKLGRLWVPALVLLVIGAVYEAVEITYLVPLLPGH